MRLGVHCSIRNGLLNAINEAIGLNCETIQIFTRSPRVWKKIKFSNEEIEKFHELRMKHNLMPLTLHVAYLPNLATSKKMLYKKSIRTLIQDLKLAKKIKANYLAIHPGAYSLSASLNDGIRLISDAINFAFEEVGDGAVLLIENVSGGGRKICKRFEEIRDVIDKIKYKERVGVCFDTAHGFAAGYDLSSKEAVEETIKKFNNIIGISFLKLLHLNDSLFPFGSQRDRHYHIGKGKIGLDGFRAILNHNLLNKLPGILETPKDSPEADHVNLETLRNLLGEK